MNDASILVLAWPDTPVRTAYGFYEHIFRLGNLNGSGIHLAGHAALCLIHKDSGKMDYFDFGRYITPFGTGRVRSKETDPEIEIPIKAVYEHNRLINLNDILKILHSLKVLHGEGSLWASLLTDVDFSESMKIISAYQDRGHIKYGPFTPGGSNCSRFVSDILIRCSVNFRTRLKLMFPLSISPTPLGNVLNISRKEVYQVSEGNVSQIAPGRLMAIQKIISNLIYPSLNYSDIDSYSRLIGSVVEPDHTENLPDDLHWLGGIGAGSWFSIVEDCNECLYLQRFDANGSMIFSKRLIESKAFNYNAGFKIDYGTNAKVAVVAQNKKKILLSLTDEIDPCEKISSDRLAG